VPFEISRAQVYEGTCVLGKCCHPAAMYVITHGHAGSLPGELGCPSATGAQGQLPWTAAARFQEGDAPPLPCSATAEQGNAMVQSTARSSQRQNPALRMLCNSAKAQHCIFIAIETHKNIAMSLGWVGPGWW